MTTEETLQIMTVSIPLSAFYGPQRMITCDFIQLLTIDNQCHYDDVIDSHVFEFDESNLPIIELFLTRLFGTIAKLFRKNDLVV